jgi:hypothetical protein
MEPVEEQTRSSLEAAECLVSPTVVSSEHSYAVMESPRQLKRRCQEQESELQKTKRALYNAERREARAKSSLSAVLSDLENERLIYAECRRLLNSFENLPLYLFTKQSPTYTEEQRQFATTLHFYSPKAYEFCRKIHKLPAVCTIRRWLTGINCMPGFSEQVFASLKGRVEGPEGWQYKSCCVMIDGMAIRRHIDWDPVQQKMIGYTDLGVGSLDNDSQNEATEALVIMAVGLQGHWKVSWATFSLLESMQQFSLNLLGQLCVICMILASGRWQS